MGGLGVPLNRMEPSHFDVEIRLGNEWVSPLMFPKRDVAPTSNPNPEGKAIDPQFWGGPILKAL